MRACARDYNKYMAAGGCPGDLRPAALKNYITKRKNHLELIRPAVVFYRSPCNSFVQEVYPGRSQPRKNYIALCKHFTKLAICKLNSAKAVDKLAICEYNASCGWQNANKSKLTTKQLEKETKTMRKNAKTNKAATISRVQSYHEGGNYSEAYAFAGFQSNKYFTSDRYIKLDANFTRTDGKPLKGYGIEIETECSGVSNQRVLAEVLDKIIFHADYDKRVHPQQLRKFQAYV